MYVLFTKCPLHVSVLTAPSSGRTLITFHIICYCKVVIITQRSPAMWQLQMQVEHKSTMADTHLTFTQRKHLAVTLRMKDSPQSSTLQNHIRWSLYTCTKNCVGKEPSVLIKSFPHFRDSTNLNCAFN